MVDDLNIPASSKKDLKELIEHNLIADYLTLRESPNMVKGWKEVQDDMLSYIEDLSKRTYRKDEMRVIGLTKLAYLRALNPPDTVIINRVDNLIENLPQNLREEFDGMLKASRRSIIDA